MSSTKTCEASKAVMMKANITYSFLRQYICKIQNQLSAKERTLCLQWCRKLRPSTDSTEDSLKYIERMLNEMMEGYLCYPFNAMPPEGTLPPLPPQHAHSEREPSLESLLSDNTLQSEEYNRQESKVNKTTAEVPMPSDTTLQSEACNPSGPSDVKKPTGGHPLEFLLEVDESEMSSLNTTSSDDLDDALETRSEPNRQSKSHLRGYSLDITRWSEETGDGTDSIQKHVHQGLASEERNIKEETGDSELSKSWKDGSQELTSEADKAGAAFGIQQYLSNKGNVFGNDLANKIEMKTSIGNAIADGVLTKTENNNTTKALMREDQVHDLDTARIALHYADIVSDSTGQDKLEDQGDDSLKPKESVANFERIIEHNTKTEKTNSIESYRSYLGTLINEHRDKTKEVQEVFLNKNYTSETGDLLLDFVSDGDFEKSHHVFDMLVKFANCYEKRGTKSLAIEEKVRTLTRDNENLVALNRKYKAKIQNLVEKIREGGNRDPVGQTDEEAEHIDDKQEETADVQNEKINTTSADATTSMQLVNVESKETTAALLVSGEKLEDLTTKLNTLINKSNFHNEKLAALDVKFNLVRDDYELERREMILKFKAIDSLHQNILTELVKRQMSEAKEYQHLIDHYRARFSEKNAEIARLQNNACDACARRMTSGKDKIDGKHGHGDVDERSDGSESIGEALKLRREIDRLRQTNKELIYTYERKIKRLMNEKYLESKLKDSILKAQREELELHLSGTKHEELRALADRLECQYSRVVDEAMRQAVSKLDVANTSTANVKT